MNDNRNVKITNLAYENMSRPIIYHPPLTDLVIFHDFYRIYTFFMDIYEMHIGRKMDYAEKEKIHLSKLDERLVFALDKFDEVTETPEPTAEYFQKLKKVKWKDEKSKKLLGRLNRLNRSIQTKKWGMRKSSTLGISEKKFILFLAGCNAINNNKDKINMQDVIKAYKTYFKLLKTDLPSLIDRLWEENKLIVN